MSISCYSSATEQSSRRRVCLKGRGAGRDRQIDRRMGSDRCEGELGWAVCKQEQVGCEWPGEDRRGSLFAVMTRRNGGAEGETRSRRHEKGAKRNEMIQTRRRARKEE